MNLISELTRGVFLFKPDVAQQYFPLVHNLVSGQITSDSFEPFDPLESFSYFSMDSNGLLARSLSGVNEGEGKPRANSVIVCDLIGPITKYDGLCHMGVKSKLEYLIQADSDPSVIAHILRIDSGGGEAYASKTFSDGLNKLSKPVFAFVDGMAASAAYWIASSCQLICAASQMDRVGSIGTYVTIADYREWFLQQGIKHTEIYALKSTDKNADYLSAIDGDTSRLQSIVDTYNQFFLDHIILSREELSLNQGAWDTGLMFFSPEAKEIGLIDMIADFDSFCSHIIAELSV
jgi:ClpP class serine protease